jgi:transcriptional regulator with XRE-family HTH domain
MLIGERIRQLRAQKRLSQGDIERTSGLLRCYISRVEHGHTVPSLETLERFALALNVPLYQLFYEGEEPPSTPNLTPRHTLEELAQELDGGPEASFLLKVRKLLSRMTEPDRTFLLEVAEKLAGR